MSVGAHRKDGGGLDTLLDRVQRWQWNDEGARPRGPGVEALPADVLVEVARHLHPDDVESLLRAVNVKDAVWYDGREDELYWRLCERRLRRALISEVPPSSRDPVGERTAGGEASHPSLALISHPRVRRWRWRDVLRVYYMFHRWLLGVNLWAPWAGTVRRTADAAESSWSAASASACSVWLHTTAPAGAIGRPRARVCLQRFQQRSLAALGDGALGAFVVRGRQQHDEEALVVSARRIAIFEAQCTCAALGNAVDDSANGDTPSVLPPAMQLCSERSALLVAGLATAAAVDDRREQLVVARDGCIVELRCWPSWNVIADFRVPSRVSNRDVIVSVDVEGDRVAAGTTDGRLLLYDAADVAHPDRLAGAHRRHCRPECIEQHGIVPVRFVRLCRSHEDARRPDVVVSASARQMRVFHIELGGFVFQREFEYDVVALQAARRRSCVYIASGGTIDIIELPLLQYAATLGRPSILSDVAQLTCMAVDGVGNVAGGWSSGDVTFWPAVGKLTGVALASIRGDGGGERQGSRTIASVGRPPGAEEVADEHDILRAPIASVYVERDRVATVSADGLLDVFATTSTQRRTGHVSGADAVVRAWQYRRTARIALGALSGTVKHLAMGECMIVGGLCGRVAATQPLPLVLLRIMPQPGAEAEREAADDCPLHSVMQGVHWWPAREFLHAAETMHASVT
ncbi:hypothetical protein CDCA_CDCA03G0910 [Cyanidium caldarium]|uniref:F-box domain-containing protein n=1 Tax=Cyanidium caldarium TaxID=2771 RepID=A0AAV9IS07_CYACA|nr:hypothetical protein CDCA_CDCA03G0910 [Cyanidium caldarium]